MSAVNNARYVWIFNFNSKPTGIWVSKVTSVDPNLSNVLKSAVTKENSMITNAGYDPNKLGFGTKLYKTMAEQNYRTVANEYTVVANNVAFDGGTFFMLSNNRAPSESDNPKGEWEVRKNGGQFNLLPIQGATLKNKKWWEFW
ncbi:hypothetical protein [Spongiimicrobium sp. 3-5]|uniref:hypothetical protein n=1 Tax=Spongiimicrobium sp. 3-5 TaxID=3332596 RepID=UPI00397F68A7